MITNAVDKNGIQAGDWKQDKVGLFTIDQQLLSKIIVSTQSKWHSFHMDNY